MSKAIETSVPTQNGTGEALSDDNWFDILSNHRRRYVLHHLQGNGEQTTLGELSEQVAAWENDTDVENVSATQRKRAYTSLQQVHLPRMDELDIVEYDDRAGTVELGPAGEDLDIYLEVVQGNDIPWSEFYVGLAMVNLGLLTAVAVDTVPLTAIPDLGWAVFSTTTFLVTAVCHFCLNRREMLLGREEAPPDTDA